MGCFFFFFFFCDLGEYGVGVFIRRVRERHCYISFPSIARRYRSVVFFKPGYLVSCFVLLLGANLDVGN